MRCFGAGLHNRTTHRDSGLWAVQGLYEELYCEHADMENRIEAQQPNHRPFLSQSY
jgi:hypothetical protein